jgi:uncharacterized protein involved in exopolysaccharide biosynthesis
VTTIELTRKLFIRLGKVKLIIVLVGIAGAALLYLYAKKQPVIYTSRASVFPLTGGNESSGASSLLSSITGLSDVPKSFSQEASINIVELATSRNTREAVAMEMLPRFGNKSIGRLLIESANKYKPFFGKDIKIPTNDTDLAAVGGNILKATINAKINKNGILELTFSNADYNLITPVSNVLIEKISQFYKDLKVKKAKVDYDFTVRKMDSLQGVLNEYDKRAIHMANTTLFTSPDKIEFTIPKENLISDKGRVLRQRDASANNKEEALWRLQKVTPIIETLDKPEAPFDTTSPSALMYGFVGFLLGCFVSIALFVSDILYKYINTEINDAVFGDKEESAAVVVNSSEVSTTL